MLRSTQLLAMLMLVLWLLPTWHACGATCAPGNGLCVLRFRLARVSCTFVPHPCQAYPLTYTYAFAGTPVWYCLRRPLRMLARFALPPVACIVPHIGALQGQPQGHLLPFLLTVDSFVNVAGFDRAAPLAKHAATLTPTQA